MTSQGFIMGIGSKIRHIREMENLKQVEFARITGIVTRTLRAYEAEQRKEISIKEILKITNHPRFKKYTMLLMSDSEVDPDTPVLSENDFAEKFAQLSEERAEQAIQYMEFLLSQQEKEGE